MKQPDFKHISDEQLDRLLRESRDSTPIHIDEAESTDRFLKKLEAERRKYRTYRSPSFLTWLRPSFTTAAVFAAVLLVIVLILVTGHDTALKPEKIEIARGTENRSEEISTQDLRDEGTEPLSSLTPSESEFDHKEQTQTFTLTGKVLNPDGLPAPDFHIAYQSLSDAELHGKEDCINGSFWIPDLPRGRYRVTATSDEFLGEEKTTDTVDDPLSFQLASSGRLKINARKQIAASDTATQTTPAPAQPVAGIKISLRSAPDASHKVAMTQTTGDDGIAVFEGLPKDTYNVSAEFEGFEVENAMVWAETETAVAEESLGLEIPEDFYVPKELIDYYQTMPADFIGRATYSCILQKFPFENREKAEHAAFMLYNNPWLDPYREQTEAEIERWINTVTARYELEYTATLDFSPNTFGLSLMPPMESVFYLFAFEYFGTNGVSVFEWRQYKEEDYFGIFDLDKDAPMICDFLWRNPNLHSATHPLAWYAPETFTFKISKTPQGSWIIDSTAQNESTSIRRIRFETIPGYAKHLKSIRSCGYLDKYRYYITQIEPRDWRTSPTGISMPGELQWTYRKGLRDQVVSDMEGPWRSDNNKDNAYTLRLLESQTGTFEEIFPSQSTIPQPVLDYDSRMNKSGRRKSLR